MSEQINKYCVLRKYQSKHIIQTTSQTYNSSTQNTSNLEKVQNYILDIKLDLMDLQEMDIGEEII